MAARKILVIGSGGREHALAARLLGSASVAEVVVAPGNAGTELAPAGLAPGKVLRNVSGDPLAVALAERPDLVVVGPEGPLCAGLVDRLAEHGIAAYGPSLQAARLEASKAYMKEFALAAGLRTARFRIVSRLADLDAALADFQQPPVVKADGLCAGKGVVVAESFDEAREAAVAMLSGELFGAAGHLVVLEERVVGEEASVHAICDGERAFVLPAAQDHKRLGDGDRGPNTGGMGTYAPAPLVTGALAQRIEREVFEPTLRELRARGTPFRGTLFAGFMITPSGDPWLLEFNVRFGDPETQVLMHVLDGDLAEALVAAAAGRLDPTLLTVNASHAVCVVLAAAGYPKGPRQGDVIAGLQEASAMEAVSVYHAGTRRQDARVVTAGGRVLGITAHAPSLRLARERAYAAVERVHFEGCQWRRDIAERAL